MIMRLKSFIVCAALMLAVSCSPFEDYEGGYPNTPTGNFEALWHIMDTRYCYFTVKKQQLGVDWDEVHVRYRQSVSDDMSSYNLFEVLAAMLDELQDGHVNLYGPYDISRNYKWQTDSLENFSEKVQRLYLGDDYKLITSGYKYTILPDNTGYLYISSFSNRISASQLDAILSYFTLCNGIIIDIRGNGGGYVDVAELIAGRFTNEKVLVGYNSYKTGDGHDDFSKPAPRYVVPPADHIRWQKPVALLTNRGCYSAANDFTLMMKSMPRSRQFGDRTGGGGGLPASSELPCGWSVRFSSGPSYDKAMNEIETGIEPDAKVFMTDNDTQSDPIIEAAREWISSMLVNP